MKGRLVGWSGASITALALMWAISLGAAGCYPENCAETFSCEPPPAPPPPCGGDPATTPAKEDCGVFVARGGDDARAGTRQEPVRTLQHAVSKALLSGKPHVYACAEDFHEAVRLPSGVEIWGGRACKREDWAYLGARRPTVVAPREGAGEPPRRGYASSSGQGSSAAGGDEIPLAASTFCRRSSISRHRRLTVASLNDTRAAASAIVNPCS